MKPKSKDAYHSKQCHSEIFFRNRILKHEDMIQISESIQLTAFPPKVRFSSINMAGLLTHLPLDAFPDF